MTSPTVSVVMSVYNGEEFLAQAVESILAQTFSDFEFVIIDDGSKDKTAEILDGYAKRDGRVRVFPQENRGRAESLNRGIEVSRGRYIARMDADDVSLPNRLKEQVEFLNVHQSVGLLGGAYEHIDARGVVLGIVPALQADAELRTRMLTWNAMCHPAVIMRKDIVTVAGGYRKQFLDADDYDLWLRMIEHCQVANIGHPLLRYRIHAGQVSVRNMKHQIWCVFAARASAACRKRGEADPLSDVNCITRELVASLGFSDEEIGRAMVSGIFYWVPILRESSPDAALALIRKMDEFAKSGLIDRCALANAWLDASKICYGQGRVTEGRKCVLRALWLRPYLIGRPIKRAFSRMSQGN
jgi:glycosyltransferase involved in cell wall biosynthesis